MLKALAKIPLAVKILFVVGVFWIVNLLLGYAIVSKIPSSNGQITSNQLGYTWYVWDTYYYHEIATRGYQEKPFNSKRMENWAFFPLYPMTWRLFLPLADSLDLFVLAGMSLSVVFFSAALYVLYLLMKFLGMTDAQFWLSIALLLTFPTSYVFVLPYTEALFLFVSILSIYALFKKQYALSAVAASLALVTRSTGITLVPIVLLYTFYHEIGKKPFLSLAVFLLTQIAVMLSPLLLFFTYLQYQTGNFWAAIKIQDAWFNGNSHPLKGLITYLQEFGLSVYWPHYFQMVLLVVLLLSAPYVLYRFIRQYASTKNALEHVFLWMYTFLHLFIISSVASRNSLFRFVLVIFPLFWWLPTYLQLSAKKVAVIAGMFSIAHVFFLAFFVLKYAYYGY